MKKRFFVFEQPHADLFDGQQYKGALHFFISKAKSWLVLLLLLNCAFPFIRTLDMKMPADAGDWLRIVTISLALSCLFSAIQLFWAEFCFRDAHQADK
jgi:hypothetical protein